MRMNGLLKGRGGFQCLGSFDEVGVFQRAGRRDGELDGLSIVYFLEVKENEVK